MLDVIRSLALSFRQVCSDCVRRSVVVCGLAVALLAGLVSCDDEVRSLYSHHPAFFRFTPVSSAAAPLFSALNNPGIFCIIRMDVSHYYFQLADKSPTTWPRSGYEIYGAPICITGFIAGMPSIPDTKGNFFQIAFDLVCPKCYEQAFINRDVVFDKSNREEVVCPKCGTRYSLKNDGIPLNAASAPSLYRYACSYSPANDMFVIQNMMGY